MAVADDDGAAPPPPPPDDADGWDPAASAAVAERRAAVASLSIDDCGDGSYAIRFTIAAAGEYVLRVRGGRAASLFDSVALPVRVVPGRPHAALTAVRGRGLRGAAAGEAVPVELIAHDALGNRCDGGGAGFELQLWHAAGDAAPALGGQPSYVSCTLEDNGDGSYSGTSASARVGAYLLSALLDGVPVAPPASVAVLPGRTSAAASALAPAAPSVVVGTPAAVAIIHARDAHGNGQLTGGDRWEGRCVRDGGDGAAAVWSGVGAVASVRDYWSEAATVRDRGDGTYAVEVHASAAGRYALSASLLHSAPRGPQPLDPYESDLGGGSGHRERHEAARPLPQPPLLFDATAAPLSELCSVEWLLPPHPFVAGELRVLIRAADGHGNGVTTLPPGASAFFERLRDDDESAPPLRVTARLVGVGAAGAASGAPSDQRLHHRHADPPPTPLSGATMLARGVFGDAAAATAAATPPPTAAAAAARRCRGCACWRSRRWRGGTCRWWCSEGVGCCARPTASRRRWCRRRRARHFRTRTARASPAGWRARRRASTWRCVTSTATRSMVATPRSSARSPCA